MNLADIARRSQKFTIDNSPLLLTITGAIGIGATAYLAWRGGFKAALILDQYEAEHPKPDLKKKVNLVWRELVPPVVAGGVTVIAVVGANQIGTKRTAALAAAYSISETAFKDYKKKVVEKIGEHKEQAVRDEIAQERVNANPLGANEVVVVSEGEVECYDQYSGRYFSATMEEIKRAQNEVNHQINNQGYASLNDFYDAVGLSRINVGDEVGWKIEKLLDVNITTTLNQKGRPCLAIDFHVEPVRDYFRFGR